MVKGEVQRKVTMDLDLTHEIEGENIFFGSAKVKQLKEELRAAEKEHDQLKKDNILAAFRTCVATFVEKAGCKPKVALMSYYDRQFINEAWEEEYRKLHEIGSDTYMMVDGIKIAS